MDDLINNITFGILATTGNDAYSCGMRNGMKWCKSLLDGEEPDFEEVPSAQPEQICVANVMLTDKQVREAVEKAKDSILTVIEPERKMGKWVRCDGDWLKTMCKCSECGAMIDINEKYRNFFCYHCGVRIEENNESD